MFVVDSEWWYVSMIYLEDSVHYGLFCCSCDFMKIVVFMQKKKKRKMWTACEYLELVRELELVRIKLTQVILIRF